jgi:hypothetical protein
MSHPLDKCEEIQEEENGSSERLVTKNLNVNKEEPHVYSPVQMNKLIVDDDLLLDY